MWKTRAILFTLKETCCSMWRRSCGFCAAVKSHSVHLNCFPTGEWNTSDTFRNNNLLFTPVKHPLLQSLFTRTIPILRKHRLEDFSFVDIHQVHPGVRKTARLSPPYSQRSYLIRASLRPLRFISSINVCCYYQTNAVIHTVIFILYKVS